MISYGVFITRSRGLHSNTANVDTTIETTLAVRMLIEMAFLMLSRSFAPNFWLMMTENPAVRPMTKPKTKKLTPPVDPTAARALTPMNRPTMIVSTML